MKLSLTRTHLRLAEMLLVTTMLAALTLLLRPIAHAQEGGAGERARQTTCLSQVRQLATAVQMYNQDNNGRFPGIQWAPAIATYLGDSLKMFQCPCDTADEDINTISYGYAGILVRGNGTGVNEAQIIAPTEVGVICDAAPSRRYPRGGLVGGGGLQRAGDVLVGPIYRHMAHGEGGIIVGYCDGHAKYYEVKLAETDLRNPVTRAFYLAPALGTINNPAGGVLNFTPKRALTGGTLMIGGDYCTYPLIVAAAEIWKVKAGATYFTRGFVGEFAPKAQQSDYIWGFGSGNKPSGNAVALARDAVVIITAKHSQIPPRYFAVGEDDAQVLDATRIRKLFATGSGEYVSQVYTYNMNSGTRRYFTRKFGVNKELMPISAQAVEVISDAEMVDKVANDPYGVGYCSSVFADPERVNIPGVRDAGGTVHYFPNTNAKHRWEYPIGEDWPLLRTLYARCAGTTWQVAKDSGIGNVMLAPGAVGKRAMQAGPLFKASYLPPR